MKAFKITFLMFTLLVGTDSQILAETGLHLRSNIFGLSPTLSQSFDGFDLYLGAQLGSSKSGQLSSLNETQTTDLLLGFKQFSAQINPALYLYFGAEIHLGSLQIQSSTQKVQGMGTGFYTYIGTEYFWNKTQNLSSSFELGHSFSWYQDSSQTGLTPSLSGISLGVSLHWYWN